MRGKKSSVARSTKSQPRRRATSPATSSQALQLPASRYLFFGGKGGVGKTTAAAATALALLDAASKGEQILLFSTDPAHSLSDSLDARIGDRPTGVAERRGARLLAYEMDASAALEKFKTRHRAVLSEIAERGTLLDTTDINELLDLSLPGLDEVMALFELSELNRAGAYTRIVIDTAPTGHTSRLLRLPTVLTHMVKALDHMSDKHRYIMTQFARGAAARMRLDEVDLFLKDLNERIERVRAMLNDARQTSFTIVAIPEQMSVMESERYFRLLEQENVPVTDLIINRIEQRHNNCPYCRTRADGQKPSLKKIARTFKALPLHHVPLLPTEVRGLEALRAFASLVWSNAQADAETWRREDAVKRKSSCDLVTSPRPRSFASPAPRLLIFGGKGGVGKTTAAAATALALAEQDSRRSVLIFSIDPAHSLSDSLGEKIGEFKSGIVGLANLDAMEINPAARFEELKNRYRAWTDELFATLTGGSRLEVQFEREAMREMVELAPPGIDEIAALSVISDLVDEGKYARIVLDTAPTGHLLRFLELPGVALSWVRTFLKLLLKYKNIVRTTSGVAEELIALSKSIKRIIALLTDAQACAFCAVAIPEEMSFAETVGLTRALERLKVPLRGVLINGVIPEEAAAGCQFCAARRRAQIRVIKNFRERFKSASELLIAPQQSQEVRKAERLRKHFNNWRVID